MLDRQQTIEYIRLAKAGDNDAKEILLQSNTSLIKSILRRYRNKGIEYDDLFQLACVGFLKAISNFDEKYAVCFSTYAVPMIAGEIKRFMRDDGSVKVSRSVKLLGIKINKYIQEYLNTKDKEPSLKEIATEMNVDESEVALALDASRMPLSLFEKNGDDGDGTELIERIPSTDGEAIIDKLFLKNLINELGEREKKIIIMRYFRDMTQSEIAAQMGISQVQVSRLETKIIEKMKTKI